MTDIRSKLSKDNPYWISQHRYYELRHFCLQYHEWQQVYNSLNGYSTGSIIRPSKTTNSDITGDVVAKRERYLSFMRIVEESALKTDKVIGPYIFEAVTDGLTYEKLKARKDIPCCREVFYKMYRKFFYILNNARD